MAKTRKIAECVNVRINLGNWQHIELVKYAEEEISYSTESDRIEQENSLRDDLVQNLIRSMNEIPAKIGKGVAESQSVEELIKTKLPDWIKNGPIPNIANNALKREVQVAAEQKNLKDKDQKNIDEAIGTERLDDAKSDKSNLRATEVVASATLHKVEKAEDELVFKTEISKISSSSDLFEDDDADIADKKVESKVTTSSNDDLFEDNNEKITKPVAKPVAVKDDDFNFDDDDLF